MLSGLSFTAVDGAITGLLGPNGAGKSTLLKTVLGVLSRDGGEVEIDGVDPAAVGRDEIARRIGYVPQRSLLGVGLNVANVVAMGRFAHRGMLARFADGDRAAIDAAMTATDCSGIAARSFDQLSNGEQQRVLLARALATGASTLLLDEPTAGLDVGHVLHLHATLRRLAAAGRCVLIVLHHLDEAAALTDRLVLLHGGRVLASGTPGEVLTTATLRIAYGVEPAPGSATGYRLQDER